jgi:hypothetical protein
MHNDEGKMKGITVESNRAEVSTANFLTCSSNKTKDASLISS